MLKILVVELKRIPIHRSPCIDDHVITYRTSQVPQLRIDFDPNRARTLRTRAESTQWPPTFFRSKCTYNNQQNNAISNQTKNSDPSTTAPWHLVTPDQVPI